MDTESENRLKEVCPELAIRVRKAADLLSKQGFTVRVIQALRSWDMQQELWQQGRDINGKVIDKGKVVTDAAPGTSWHEYGLAIDVAPFDEKGQPIWNFRLSPGKEAWGAIEKVAPEVQLFSGACFHSITDRPHWQPSECPEVPTDEDRGILRETGVLQSIWQEYKLED
jgi:peptidoglycan L-alanyl-D-glutamate endopeptidase CwlK